jgi:hypothetical protein
LSISTDGNCRGSAEVKRTNDFVETANNMNCLNQSASSTPGVEPRLQRDRDVASERRGPKIERFSSIDPKQQIH